MLASIHVDIKVAVLLGLDAPPWAASPEDVLVFVCPRARAKWVRRVRTTRNALLVIATIRSAAAIARSMGFVRRDRLVRLPEVPCQTSKECPSNVVSK